MPKQTVHMGRSEESLFELISRGRKGPGDTLALTPGQVAAVEQPLRQRVVQVVGHDDDDVWRQPRGGGAAP